MSLVLRKCQDTCNIVVFSGFFLLREITDKMAASGVAFGLLNYKVSLATLLEVAREKTNHDVVHERSYIVIQSLAMSLLDQKLLGSSQYTHWSRKHFESKLRLRHQVN
jgi:hypothetical protein